MISEKHVEELTKARSLLTDRKRSGWLIFFNAAMSFGRRRGCFRALAK